MTEQEKIIARLQNTEKALCALATLLEVTQPPHTQEGISQVMNCYFDANTSLGFKPGYEFARLGEEK